MNVWELLLNILGWVLVIALVLVALAFLAGLVIYIVKDVRTTLKRRKLAKAPKTRLSDEVVMGLAEDRVKRHMSVDLFGNGTAFINGAKFALEAKKERTDVDRI